MNSVTKFFLEKKYDRSKILFYLSLFLVAVPILAGFYYIIAYSVNVPYYDQWYIDVHIAIKYFDGTLGPGDFLTLHNDGRYISSYLITVPTLILTHVNVVAECMVAYCLHIVSFLLLVYITRQYIDLKKNLYLFIPVSFFYFNFYLLGIFLWGLSLYYSLCSVSMLLTIYFLHSSKKTDRSFFAALFSAIVCMFSFTAGVTIWIVGLFQLFIQRRENKVKKLIWVGVTVVLLIINYIVLGVRSDGYHGTEGYKLYLLTAVFYPAQKFLCWMGSIGSQIIHDKSIALFFGILIVAITLIMIFLNRERLDLEKTSPWYAVILFTSLVTLELALTRSGAGGYWGPSTTIFFISEIRHYESIILLIITLFILSFYYTLVEIERYNTSKGKDKSINKLICNVFILGIFLSLLLCGIFCHTISGLSYGKDWKETRSLEYQNVSDYQNQPNATFENFFPKADAVYLRSQVKKLNTYNLSVFRKP